MMPPLLVSDTNILIDLFRTGLLDAFFSLPFEFFTTDFVLNELTDAQQKKRIDRYTKSKKLKVKGFAADELPEIFHLQEESGNNTSFVDCSVWYYAKVSGGTLLTGDNKLRKAAEKDSIKVAGIIYVFDELENHRVLARAELARLMKKLQLSNPRLPKTECGARIAKWTGNS